MLLTDAASAEMAKLVENAYRDVNIAFANELSLISEELRLDVWEVIKMANHHPRVNILSPGPGVGGHCIAVDPWFIVGASPTLSKLIRPREINDRKPHHVAAQVLAKTERFRNPTVTCLGLAYKANVDDFRESPALDIVEHIADQAARPGPARRGAVHRPLATLAGGPTQRARSSGPTRRSTTPTSWSSSSTTTTSDP